MTLAELLIAGAIAGSSCCASVQVWGQAAKSARSARDLTDASALLERHWLASRRWLAAAPMTEICTLEAEALGEALEQAKALAAKIAENGPLAVKRSKQVIKESIDWSQDEMFANQQEITSAVFSSEDAIEGATAFAEKRKPNWKGR